MGISEAGSGSEELSLDLSPSGSGDGAAVSAEEIFGGDKGVAGAVVGAGGISAVALTAGVGVIDVSPGAGAMALGFSVEADPTVEAVVVSVETSLGFSRSFGAAESATLASDGTASGAGGGGGGFSGFDGVRGFRRKGDGGGSSLMPMRQTSSADSRN